MADARVIDSWALICYLEQEPGHAKVARLLDEAASTARPLLMSVINWGEVYYQMLRRLGDTRADEISQLIATFPIRIVAADQEATREAARIKAVTPISYADCFAAALAKAHKATLYTADPEFKLLEKQVKVFWLR